MPPPSEGTQVLSQYPTDYKFVKTPLMGTLARLTQQAEKSPEAAQALAQELIDASGDLAQAILGWVDITDNEIVIMKRWEKDLLVRRPDGDIWLCPAPPAKKKEAWMTLTGVRTLAQAVASFSRTEDEDEKVVSDAAEPERDLLDFGDEDEWPGEKK